MSSLATFCATATLVFLVACGAGSGEKTAAPAREPDLLVLSGVRYGDTDVRVVAGELVREKTSIGALSLNLADELILRNVRIAVPRVTSQGDGTGDWQIDARAIAKKLVEMTATERAGILVKIRIEDLQIDVMDGADRLFLIAANEAEIDSRSNSIRLHGGLSVTARGGQQIDARRGRWLQPQWRLEANGPLELRDGETRKRGSDLAFTLDRDGVIRPVSTPAL